MAVYCISYDLQSNNYNLLNDAIQSYGFWWHQSGSTWFIETDHTTKQVLENLRIYLNKGDKLMVIQVRENWWATGHTEEEYNWIKQRNF